MRKQKFEMSGTDKVKHFTAKIDAKFFSIMFDKLYSNKIAAVVRELSTNAYEIHQECNKEHVPFHVKLPSWSDMNFIIRDYGTGLTEHEVDRIYTRVFESTKDSSNILGGGFGLGSKSAWAYCNSFIVNSYVNGTKYSYFFIKDSSGCPSYTLADKSHTTEENGLEVCISVNSGDVDEFRLAAQNTYKWFKHKPKVTGNSRYVAVEKPVPLIHGDGWEYCNQSNTPVAVMGNISYTLSNYPKTNQFLVPGLVLYFNIGEISPAPNRETLSFDKTTIANIDKRLQEIGAVIQTNIEDQIKGCKNFWEAVIKAREINTVFHIKTINYNGQNVLSQINFPKGKEQIRIVSRRQPLEKCEYVMPCNHGIVPKFYVDDLSRGGITRIKNDINGRSAFYCTIENVDEFKKLMLLEDDQLIYTSKLPKPQYAPRRTTATHKTKVMQLIRNSQYATHCWQDCDVDLTNDTGYYVEVSNNKIQHTQEMAPSIVFNLANALNMTIFGVKTAHLKKINDKKWKNGIEAIYDNLQSVINANKSVFDNRVTLENINVNYYQFCNTLKKISKILAQHSASNELLSVVSIIDQLNKTVNDKQSIITMLKYANLAFGNDATIYRGTEDIKLLKKIDHLKTKYKLLNYHVPETEELVYYCLQILRNGR